MAQVNTAPEEVQLMEQPAGIVPGLEPLLHASHLIVKEKKDMVEMFSGFERSNRYEIYNEAGQMVLYAAEDSINVFWLCCCSPIRPFTIRIFDAQRRQGIVLHATINCFTQTVSVEVPEGRCFAVIYREFACLPSFFIKDAAGAVMFQIRSPLSAAIGSFRNVNFDVLSADGQTVVGQISKQWGGLAKEMFTGADTFGISLPADMDVTWKAVLLAAVFHVDFSYYQQQTSGVS